MYLGLAKHFTYEEIDRAPEEKKRGITIASTTLEYQTEKRHFSHIDCPGHKDYVKNMITGAARIECAILVVSAQEGPMAQTKEHLLLCKQAGVKNVLVYLSKADMVGDNEMYQLIELEVRELLNNYGFDGKSAFFVKGSALCYLEGKRPDIGEESIKELLDTLSTKVSLPERLIDKPFLLSVENTIYLKVLLC